MPALEVVTARGTAIGATLAPLTLLTGDSRQLRNGRGQILMLNSWVKSQVSGEYRIRSAAMHDDVDGIRGNHVLAEVYPQLPYGAAELLRAQDNLTFELSGSAVVGDMEFLSVLTYYEQIDGIAANLISLTELASRFKKKLGTTNTIATVATGEYGGGEAINVERSNFKPNTDYAILGANISALCHLVGIRGSFSGNVRMGIPGNAANREVVQSWFIWLSQAYGLPLIPVFNSAEVGSILVDAVQDENGADVLVNLICAELGPRMAA